MSFLQQMGIQQWRLRGRKAVSCHEPEAVSALNETGRQAESHAEVTDPSLTLLEQVQQQNPPIDQVSISERVSSNVEESQDVAKDQFSSPSLDANGVLPEPAEPSTSGAAQNNSAAKLSSSTTKPNNVKKNEVKLPTLRPAPVPLAEEPEMDLSLANASELDAGLATPLSSAPLPVASMDLVPDYTDADIPPSDDDIHDFGFMGMEPDALGIPVEGRSPEPAMDELSQLDWRALQARINDDQLCPSCGPQRSVLGFGDVLADWMFIADAPTSAEVYAQTLFIERAGKLYESILEACNLQRDNVYTTTVFKCSPPEDLSLSPQCDKLIHRQIEMVQPKVIVAFGELSAQSVLRANEPFSVLAQSRHHYFNSKTVVIPSYSPQQLLAEPALKATLWQELRFVLKSIQASS